MNSPRESVTWPDAPPKTLNPQSIPHIPCVGASLPGVPGVCFQCLPGEHVAFGGVVVGRPNPSTCSTIRAHRRRESPHQIHLVSSLQEAEAIGHLETISQHRWLEKQQQGISSVLGSLSHGRACRVNGYPWIATAPSLDHRHWLVRCPLLHRLLPPSGPMSPTNVGPPGRSSSPMRYGSASSLLASHKAALKGQTSAVTQSRETGHDSSVSSAPSAVEAAKIAAARAEGRQPADSGRATEGIGGFRLR